MVPAFNEEDGLADTLEALLNQTVPADRIIVADDCSTDTTRRVALSYPGVECLTAPQNLGSKARAQNFALECVTEDLILPVDADTLLDPDYIELIKKPFEDERVAIAAGCVLTRYQRTATERGRTIEYAFGFHWHRPIQNAANSPMVCSGCCTAFRTQELREFGGFPQRTLVEDMDYTWSKQIEGRRAVYVAGAVARAADPETYAYLRVQLKRWEYGFMQNIRIHARKLWHKPVLGVWIFVALLEIILYPLWFVTPIVMVAVLNISAIVTLAWFLGMEVGLMLLPLLYAALRRKIPFWKLVTYMPFAYGNKVWNLWYAWRGLIHELILVPLRLRTTFNTYEKGH